MRKLKLNSGRIYMLLSALVILASMCNQSCGPAQPAEITEIRPLQIPKSEHVSAGMPDFQRMLASFQDVDGIRCMNYYGDFDAFLTLAGQQILRELRKRDSLRSAVGCSIFQWSDSTTTLVGRNFDNVDTGLLVGFYYPDSGYRNIGFSMLNGFGFTHSASFDDADSNHIKRLLYAPVLTVEGMNEHGVFIAPASYGKNMYTEDSTKTSLFLLHLIRKILDHAASVEEAVDIAASHSIFDNALNLISHHLLIAAPGEKSVILEWNEGRMQIIPADSTLQICTNSRIYLQSELEKRKQCWRYNGMVMAFEKLDTCLTWPRAMGILKKVRQSGRREYMNGRYQRIDTRWSSVFDLNEGTIHFCLNRDYRKVFSIRMAADPVF